MDENANDTCAACGHERAVHGLYGCHDSELLPADLIQEESRKARLFDALSAALTRADSTDWEVSRGMSGEICVWFRRNGNTVTGATLAEAVEAAINAESEAK